MNLQTMNKKHFIIALLVINSNLLFAQAPPARRLGLTYHNNNNDTSVIEDVREKLVQLALQNPNFEIADRKVSIAGYQLNKAKGDWLTVVSPNLNLNEFTIKPKTGNLFLPLWNVGVTVPLNYYTQNKNSVKVARENLYIAQAEKNERYREIRAKVLTRYEDYLMYREMLDLQSRVTQDAYLFYRQQESDFADNVIGIDDYNKSFAAYKEQQDQKLQAQRNLNVAKIDLEQLIGINIEELIGRR